MTTANRPLSITTEAIIAGLDAIAHGQQAAKRTLAEAAIGLLYEVTRSNVVLAAPTGTGKTLLATSLGKVLEGLLARPVPTVVVDATQLVPAGYKGQALEERLEPHASKGLDQSLAGVLVIDELDKLGSTGEQRFRAQCEASILTVLNGDTLPLERRSHPFSPGTGGGGFQSARWLVIGTGAFSDVRSRLHHEADSVGFNQPTCPAMAQAPATTATTMPLTLDDLRQHGGLMAETWGRFHAMATLTPPTRDDLVRVARTDASLRALAMQAAKRRVRLEFGASFFEVAADLALANHDSGYRAVASALHRACTTLANVLLPAASRRSATSPAVLVLTAQDMHALQSGTWLPPHRDTGSPPPGGPAQEAPGPQLTAHDLPVPF